MSEDGAVAHCMRMQSDRPWPGTFGGWLHQLDGSSRIVGLRLPPAAPAYEPLPEEVVDRISNEILLFLRLEEHHQNALRKRGMDDEAIKRGRYRSWPLRGRTNLAKFLAARFQVDVLLRFPGIIRKAGRFGEYLTFAGAPGLLVPVRTVTGKILGFRIRPDETGDGGKYRWLSSRTEGRESAPSPGTPVHTAIPLSLKDSETAWITEGEIKANIAADRLGVRVFSQPGAGVNVEGVVQAVVALGVRRVVIAFDADKRSNRHVQRGERTLALALATERVEVLEALWNERTGKGIDDLLVSGEQPTVTPYSLTLPKGVSVVPLSWVKERLPLPPETVSIDEARVRIAAVIRAGIESPAPGLTVIEASAGAGKTITTLLEIQEALSDGRISSVRRVLILVDSHEQIEEILGNPIFAQLELGRRSGTVAVWHGRTWEADSPGYCADKDKERLDRQETEPGESCVSTRLTENRQFVSAAFCKASGEAQCKYADECGDRGYLHNVERCEHAHVVFAAKALFSANPSLLEKFDLILIDEDMSREMFELLDVTRAQVDQWRAGLTLCESANSRYRNELCIRTGTETQIAGDGRNPIEVVGMWLGLLHRVLVKHRPKDSKETLPFLSALRAEAIELRVDLQRLLGFVADLCYDHLDCLPFETPLYEKQGWTIPLRAMHELVSVCLREIHRQDSADSCLRLRQAGLAYTAPRAAHIKILRQKHLINLDATPCDPLLRLVFPEQERIKLTVPAPLRVTQVVDALFTPAHLGKELRRINALLERVTCGEQSPVIITAMRFNPDAGRDRAEKDGAESLERWKADRQKKIDNGKVLWVSNPAARYGHFDGDSRGVNKFSDASCIIIVGHHVQNIDALRARIVATRSVLSPDSLRKTSGPEQHLVPYNWIGPDGTARARWVRRDADDDVEAMVEWSRRSTILQAIGRGRAAVAAAAGRRPLCVLLLAAHPVPELPIDRLVRMADLEAELGIQSPQQRKAPAALIAINEVRAETFKKKVQDAAARLKERGLEPTLSATAREAGLGRTGGTHFRRIEAALREEAPLLTPPSVPHTALNNNKAECGPVPPVSSGPPSDTACEPLPLVSATSGAAITSDLQASASQAPAEPPLSNPSPLHLRSDLVAAFLRFLVTRLGPGPKAVTPDQREELWERSGTFIDSGMDVFAADLAAWGIALGVPAPEAIVEALRLLRGSEVAA